MKILNGGGFIYIDLFKLFFYIANFFVTIYIHKMTFVHCKTDPPVTVLALYSQTCRRPPLGESCSVVLNSSVRKEGHVQGFNIFKYSEFYMYVTILKFLYIEMTASNFMWRTT